MVATLGVWALLLAADLALAAASRDGGAGLPRQLPNLDWTLSRSGWTRAPQPQSVASSAPATFLQQPTLCLNCVYRWKTQLIIVNPSPTSGPNEQYSLVILQQVGIGLDLTCSSVGLTFLHQNISKPESDIILS